MFIVERHFHMAHYVQSTLNTAFKRVHFKCMDWYDCIMLAFVTPFAA